MSLRKTAGREFDRVVMARPADSVAPTRQPMQFAIEAATPEEHAADVIVVGAFADGALTSAAEGVDRASGGKFAAAIELGDLNAKAGSSLMLYDVAGLSTPRVLVVSLGDRDTFGDKAFRAALDGAGKALAAGRAKEAAVAL